MRISPTWTRLSDDEAHSGEQLSLVPLHLGHHSSGYSPALGPVSEVMVGDDRPPGRPLSGPYQQVRDLSEVPR